MTPYYCQYSIDEELIHSLRVILELVNEAPAMDESCTRSVSVDPLPDMPSKTFTNLVQKAREHADADALVIFRPGKAGDR